MRTILIVEDDEELRERLRESLWREGYRVEVAGDGAEALRVLRRAGEPCLVLLDLILPVMSGWRFREEQLRDPELACSKVVVMSATGNLHDAAVDGDAHLEKPVELERLLAVVRQHCADPRDEFAHAPRTLVDSVPPSPMILEDSSPH